MHRPVWGNPIPDTTTRQKHKGAQQPLCSGTRFSRNSSGASVRLGGPLLPSSEAGPCVRPHRQLLADGPMQWKEWCLGTLPCLQKQTPLFLALTRFSSSILLLQPLAFFLLLLLLFLQCKAISCLFFFTTAAPHALPRSDKLPRATSASLQDRTTNTCCTT